MSVADFYDRLAPFYHLIYEDWEASIGCLTPWQTPWGLLQTSPGIDRIGAAMLLVDIGTDRAVFGRAERLASWVGICPSKSSA